MDYPQYPRHRQASKRGLFKGLWTDTAKMAVTFVMSALIVVYNVSMTRLEIAGREDLVNRIDNVMDWMVPLMFLGSLGVMIKVFIF